MNEGMSMIQDTMDFISGKQPENYDEIMKKDYEEREQDFIRRIDYLVMETLRLGRMLMDGKCIEAIAVMPEIQGIKNTLINLFRGSV